MNYVLIVDDEPDILDIYQIALKRAFVLDIILAESGKKALKIIEEKGVPEVIISDLNMPDGDGKFLFSSIQERKLSIPFILSTSESKETMEKIFPEIYGFIEKPNIIKPAIQLIDTIISKLPELPPYIPIRLSLLLRLGTLNFELFMQLAEKKYIKVLNADEAFLASDVERFQNKNLEHLYITEKDAELLVLSLEQSLAAASIKEDPSQDHTIMSLEGLESVERITYALGWTPEVLDAAKQTLKLSLKAVSNEAKILNLLKKKLSNPTSKFSSHVAMLSLLTCGFCFQLGWVSESTQMKLGMASLLHDLTVDEVAYENIYLWNQTAADPKVKTSEAVKYRNHPVEVANLLMTMKNLPSDIDQIILQHHEAKDGTGFPRGLTASRISPLACLFIIVEDLINFVDDKEASEMKETVELFMRQKENFYNSGNFRKVFEGVKKSLA